MIKIVSFDVDGTLVEAEYNDLIWLEEIPRLYAEKEGMNFEDAYKFILEEYEKVGEKDLRWYDINHWLKHFGIKKTFGEILEKYEDRIKVYPDVKKTLIALREKIPMIIITVMPREFLEVKLRKLDSCFLRTFSTVSDFKSVKTTHVYREVCRQMDIAEDELLHVGDLWEADYLVPRTAGVRALCVDRTGEKDGDSVIRSLEELLPLLSGEAKFS